MANNIAFKLVSPSQDLLSVETAMVIVPAVDGDMGVMVGHSPVISTLRAGEVILRDGDNDVRWFVEGGFVEVTAKKVTLLAEHAVAMADITTDSANQDILNAEAVLKDVDLANPTAILRAKADVEIAKAKLHAVQSPAYT